MRWLNDVVLSSLHNVVEQPVRRGMLIAIQAFLVHISNDPALLHMWQLLAAWL